MYFHFFPMVKMGANYAGICGVGKFKSRFSTSSLFQAFTILSCNIHVNGLKPWDLCGLTVYSHGKTCHKYANCYSKGHILADMLTF